MTRGRVGEPKRMLCDHIASTMSDRGVPARLASRIAFQLVLKCEPAHLGSLATWQAMGDQVHAEVEHLRDLGLVDRQIIVALPKLGATQVTLYSRSSATRMPRLRAPSSMLRLTPPNPRVRLNGTFGSSIEWLDS
jgi:hypothetical protein